MRPSHEHTRCTVSKHRMMIYHGRKKTASIFSYLLRPDRTEIHIYLDQVEKTLSGPNRYEIKGEFPKKGIKSLFEGLFCGSNGQFRI